MRTRRQCIGNNHLQTRHLRGEVALVQHVMRRSCAVNRFTKLHTGMFHASSSEPFQACQSSPGLGEALLDMQRRSMRGFEQGHWTVMVLHRNNIRRLGPRHT